MTSEIRANTLKNRVGLGTVSFTDTGIVVSGIVTANNFSGPFTGDLDVDGHTNLDNLSVAGVSTFTGQARFNGEIVAGSVISVNTGGSINIPDKLIHSGDTDTAIRFPAADQIQLETGGSSRVNLTNDRFQILNRLLTSGDYNYLSGTSSSTATLTLKKSASGADSIDYLQLRNNSNALLFKISGEGILYTSDVLASHEGDTNTKIRFPSDDTVSVETAGSERLRITSGGETKFTVGTNKTVKFYAASHNDETNLGAGLGFSRQSDGAELLSGIFGHSNTGLGVAARDHITFLTGGTSDVSDTEERLRITSGGMVGIGTNSPSALLHLHKASGDIIQKIESSNGAAALELRHTNGYGYINYRQDGAETFRVGQIAQFTSYSVYNPNSSLPYQLCVEGNGEVGINTHNPGNTLHLLRNTNHGISLQKGGTNPGSALIQVASYGALNLEASNNLTLKSGGSQQIFFNRGGTTVAKFDTSGRFGINQSTPASRLHISEVGSNTITIQLTNATTGHTAGQDGMTMGYSTNSTAGFINVCESGSDFTIKTGGTAAGNERLRITSTGDFGIGTDSPDRKLDVSGTGNVYGKFQSTNATGAGIEVKDISERWLIQADGGSVDGLAFYDLGRTSYRFVMGNAGQLGIGGANYGSSGQVLTSQGNSSAPTWATPASASNSPAFSAKMSAYQNCSGGNVVQFNQEHFDTDGCYDTSTYRFTPNVAGNYLITFTFYMYGSSGGILAGSNGEIIHSNYGTISKFWIDPMQNLSNQLNRSGNSGSVIIPFNGSSEYVYVNAYGLTTTGGTPRIDNNGANFSGMKLA